MFLDELKIYVGSTLLREVTFKKGLNLIIDETTDKSTDSGNNVGKTTFLRVIDFCLGGKKDSIYIDKEFKRKNEKMLKFLTEKNVMFELKLQTTAGIFHTITRPFQGKSKIDDIEYSSEPKFSSALVDLLFSFSDGRPTLGQIMNKFIRIEDEQISKALYFLHPTTDHSDYESLFMALFGFKDSKLLGDKRKNVDKFKKVKKAIEDSPQSIDDLEQQLHLIESELIKLEELRGTFNFTQSVNADLNELKLLQSKISTIKTDLAKLNLKKSMNNEALLKLSEAKSKISTEAITKLYKQAKIEILTLTSRFEDLLIFHNSMVDNKVKYIKSSLDSVTILIQESSSKLNTLLDSESKILATMSNQGALDEYDKINSKINDKSRDKGHKEGMLEVLSENHRYLKELNDKLNKLNIEISKFENTFKESLKKFNIRFSEFSEKLYGEKYYLSLDKRDNKTTQNFYLDIGNMNENFGTGKKKAQISALDLAYLKFSEEVNLKVPFFVIHDQLESVFENQIETLFEVANSIKGQFIVAVLSDKLHNISKEEIDSNCILKLSQDEKLFKLP